MLSQVRGPLGRLLDLLEHGAGWRFVRQIDQRQVGIAQDGRQQVVKVVSDATGQDAEAFQFLGVQDLSLQPAALFLGALALGDVRRSADDPDRVSGGVKEYLPPAGWTR